MIKYQNKDKWQGLDFGAALVLEKMLHIDKHTHRQTEKAIIADQYYHLKGKKTFQSFPLKNVI